MSNCLYNINGNKYVNLRKVIQIDMNLNMLSSGGEISLSVSPYVNGGPLLQKNIQSISCKTEESCNELLKNFIERFDKCHNKN